MNFENDLLDLCRLNAMEETVNLSSAVDRDVTLHAIDWKKRQLMTKIKNAPAEDSGDATVNSIQQAKCETVPRP